MNDTESHNGAGPIEADAKSLAKGLIYIHNAVGANLAGTQQLSAHLYALSELLVRKGVIGLHELDDRKTHVNQQMMAEVRDKWLGARMSADESDKYDSGNEVAIDCEKRLSLCKAACCRLGFYLSRQDLEEGIVRWHVDRPYHIAQNEAGYCQHCSPKTLTCDIRQHRPLTCRAYSCRDDKRIWVDFEKSIPNPELAHVPLPEEPSAAVSVP